MSKFDRNEMIKKYADIIDVTQTAALNIPAIADVAVKKLAPKLIPSILQRIGLGALTGLAGGSATGPAAIIFGVLGAAWAAYDIYKSLTVEAIDDLIDKIQALDYGDDKDLENVIGENGDWVTSLNNFKERIGKLGKPTIDPVENLKNVDTRFKALKEYNAKLDEIFKLWYVSGVKNRVKDWGISLDPKQFENALNSAVEEGKVKIAEVTSILNKAGKEVLDQIKLSKGIDIESIANDIVNTYEEIKNIYGKPVIFEGSEQKIFDFAKGISGGTYDVVGVEKYQPLLISLQKALENGLNIAKKRGQKISSENKYISKRALKLPDEKGTQISTKGLSVPTKTHEKSNVPAVLNFVKSIQESLNYLRTIYKMGGTRLVENGIYDKQTSEALTFLMNKVSNFKNTIEGITGFSTEEFGDIQLIKSNPKTLSLVASYLDKICNSIRSKYIGGQEENNKQITKTKVDETDSFPSDPNILSILGSRIVTVQGQQLNAYEYLKGKGLSDSAIVGIIKKLFPNRKPISWSMPALVDYAENIKRYTII